MGKAGNGMTRADMVTIIANKTDLDKRSVERVIDCFLNTIVAELSKNHKVRLSGFGTFENAAYKPRQLKSPITGTVTTLEERVIPKFKPAKDVKDRVKRKVAKLKDEELLEEA